MSLLLLSLLYLLHYRVTDKNGNNGKTFDCTPVTWHNGYTEPLNQRLQPSQIPLAFRTAYAAWLVKAGIPQNQVQQTIGPFVFTETASEAKVDTQTESTTETEAETEVEAETEAEDQATTETEAETEEKTEEKTESKLTGMSKADLSSKVGHPLNVFKQVLQLLRQGTAVFEQGIVQEIVYEAAKVEPPMEEVDF